MTEECKDIPDYEGLYQVSNLGRVKSLDRIVAYKDGRMGKFKSRVLSPGTVIGGYISAKDASTQTGIGRTSISRAATGVMRQAGGFKWQYMDKPTKRYERKHILSTM